MEFKGEEKRPLSDTELLEAVVCLANRQKEDLGWLLVGVEDDGRVTGARPHQGDIIDPLRVQALIANRTRPNLTCRAEIVSLENSTGSANSGGLGMDYRHKYGQYPYSPKIRTFQKFVSTLINMMDS